MGVAAGACRGVEKKLVRMSGEDVGLIVEMHFEPWIAERLAADRMAVEDCSSTVFGSLV